MHTLWVCMYLSSACYLFLNKLFNYTEKYNITIVYLVIVNWNN